MKNLLITTLTISLLTACEKNYTCVCQNPGGTNEQWTVKTTKQQAKKDCDKLNETSEPFSETSCYLK
ncbi:MAG: hypothetical protein J0L69_07735 [Bacteroidetes bacterium]|nr:hypothetical protein [Bacteroidota bacterium]MBN8693074.1 hypothetical protein [Bacteroidota bacterium]